LLIAMSMIVGREATKKTMAEANETIPILMYHHIVEEGKETNKITINSQRFKDDMKFLKKEGYTAISFRELIDWKEGKGDLPQKPVIITFDDGYEDNYKYAYPILKENDMKATIFVIGSRIGITNFNNDPRYSYFSWEQAREMYESGFIEIQPHSYDLHHFKENAEHGHGVLPMNKESKEDYYSRFSQDTQRVMKLIKDNVGCEIYVYAYPYGKYVSESETVLKELGFKVTLTTKSKYANISKDLYELKRINVPSHKKLSELL